jgi:hypothetical protein
MIVRRRPTLPQPSGCSTIGAERLNFRVRDGTGCFPFAMAAVTLAETHAPITSSGLGVFPSFVQFWVPYQLAPGGGLLVGNCVVDARHRCRNCCGDEVVRQALGLLVPVGWALLLYTSGLSTQCSAGGLTRSSRWETSS